MTRNEVYVLGAGFSKAANLPISSEFLTEKSFEYLKDKLNDKQNCARIEKIKNYVQFRLENKYFKNNIEEVLNHIATARYLFMESVSDNKGSYSADEIFGNLLWYITCLIDEKTKDIINSIPEEYSLFLEHVFKNKIPLITFNYDLIIENVLHILGHDFKYGLEEKKLDDGHQLILKLHGSLNWGHCKECGPINLYDKSLVYGSDSVICPVCNLNSVSTIIVPPAIYKDSYYNDQFFGSLVRESWSLAREALSKSQKIIFLGFSMAEDAYVKELFKLSLSMNNNENLQCVVVNRTCDNQLQNRYNSILVDAKPIFEQNTFENYIKSI